MTAKKAAPHGALLISLILVLVQGTKATIEIPLELLRAINAPLLQADISAHSGLEQAGRSDESYNHRRHAALAYSRGKDTAAEATDELKPLNLDYGESVSYKNGQETSPNDVAANMDDDDAYLNEVVDDEELSVPASNSGQTRKVKGRQQTPHYVSQKQHRTHNQHILASHPVSLAIKGEHRSLQHQLIKQKQASGRHCAIEISTQLEGQCQPMAVVGGFACVSGDYMDVFNADCM